MFSEEAPKMAGVSGARIDISGRKRVGKLITKWEVEYEENGKSVETEFRSLNYDDIVRRFWLKSEFLIIKKMLATYFLIWKHNGFKNRWAVLKPIVFMVIFWVILMVALLIFLGVSFGVIWGLLSLGTWTKIGASAVAFVLAWLVGRFVDKKFNHYWLIRGICFSGSQEQYDDPEYDERMQFFASQIVEADVSGEYDEILIVGHSSGSIWATEAVARAIQLDEKFAKRRSEVNVLTMGSCIGLMTGTTLDKGYHGYLRTLAMSKNIDWLDISDRVDHAANFMVDPVALLPKGTEEEEKLLSERNIPRLRRSRFFKLFNSEDYKLFKKDGYRVHFQFLCASENDAKFNYFRITCGENSIRNQFIKD